MIEEGNTNPKKSVLDELKENKLLLLVLILAFIGGAYLRFDDYAIEGYDSDDVNTIPAAVFAYYPHNYFPGLVSTEPPLGNYIIGLGCIASGEDFSAVSNVKPLFFPDRSAYIGNAAKNAENYCFFPGHVFGLIFLAGIILFAFSFFSDIRSATFFITFFSFFSLIISNSRRISVDIFLFTFVIFALTFLWRGYKTDKGTFKEGLYFSIAFAFLGLAGATKFTAGALIIFSFLLLLEKYHKEAFFFFNKLLKQVDVRILENKIEKEGINLQGLLVNAALAASSVGFFLMMFFNFSIKNLKDTYHYMTSLNFAGVQTIGFSISNFFEWLEAFLSKINAIDIFIFLFSIFILIKIAFKKQKTKQEKFVLYMVLLCFFMITLFKSKIMVGVVHAMPFMFGFFILMSWSFSDKEYSAFRLFKLEKKHFLVFMLGYLIISFLTLFFAPFYHIVSNPLVCSVFPNFSNCQKHLGYPIKQVSFYLDSVMKEDETFLTTGTFNLYTRHNDDIIWWIFYSNFKKQTGKEPGLDDYLRYYHPEDRRVRYVHTSPRISQNPADYVGVWGDIENLKRDYTPNHVIKLYGVDSAYTYDLDNLIKK